MFKIFKPLLIIFLLQNIIYSQEIVTSPIKLMSKEVSSNTATPIEQSNTQELSQSIEEQIDKQNRLVEEVINNINNESYLITLANKEQYENDINFLTNRINANKIQKNSLAVARDELKIFYLKHKIEYEQSLKV